jgi:aryl-alcohol dehydrogenase-like predicted oxidoreductase
MKKEIAIPNTGLKLFPIGLGTVGAGLDWDGADADRIFDAYLDQGGNLIDTAHVYSDWVPPETARSERVVGDWLSRSGKRGKVVLVTKGGHPDMTVPNPDTHASRMSAKDMEEDIHGSLKQLRTDYIDIYFYHRDDPKQSAGELIEVMETFKKRGLIRWYGCSNWKAGRMREADAYCHEHGYRGFAANQALLNLGLGYMKPLRDDTMEAFDEAMFAYHRENSGNLAMPYMGVCSGFFHFYAAGNTEAIKDSPYNTEKNLLLAERVRELTRQYNASVSQILLAFFALQDFDCVPLYGPQTVDQLLDALQARQLSLAKTDFAIH